MSTARLELIDETEAKIAVLRTTYRTTKYKHEFLMKIEETTHIPLSEAALAWELFDYMEWDKEDENEA